MATEAKLTADAPPMSSSAPRPHRPAAPPSWVRVPSRRPRGDPPSRGTRGKAAAGPSPPCPRLWHRRQPRACSSCCCSGSQRGDPPRRAAASCYPRSATPAVASPARTPPPRYLMGRPAHPCTTGRGAPLYRTSRCPRRRAGIA
ncbi:hypothetical protein PAHAL_9G505300 [Panicum hallii]|uniref:Uncharacterized protein n=1 Tax=Panicum hallii TaxID=206008 RepID=A0A2T8I5A3_9POAL|nr:hypothetical protein PAHAL_9G505300 [Panicum hallii]